MSLSEQFESNIETCENFLSIEVKQPFVLTCVLNKPIYFELLSRIFRFISLLIRFPSVFIYKLIVYFGFAIKEINRIIFNVFLIEYLFMDF